MDLEIECSEMSVSNVHRYSTKIKASLEDVSIDEILDQIGKDYTKNHFQLADSDEIDELKSRIEDLENEIVELQDQRDSQE